MPAIQLIECLWVDREFDRRNGIRRFIAISLLACCLGGCEIRTLYGVELVDIPGDAPRYTIHNEEYTLFLLATNDDEAPGITVIAQIDDRPNPQLEWE